MRNNSLVLFLLLTVSCSLIFAQAESKKVVEDFKPSSVNQAGKEYPQVNSEGRVRVRIEAPEAQKVQLDIGAVKYDLTKNEDGVWVGESAPQDEGFHYYQFYVSPQTAHEWQSWRRSLYQFAQLLFKQ
jgi:enterochelin esterase family protein